MAELSSQIIQKYNKKTVPQLLKICQQTFNKYIRQRDNEKPCISCQKGRVENAGHYLSQGHHSALRFNENNTNGQCVRCNLYLSGNLIHYRTNLVEKIGEEKVLQLEQTNKTAHKWNRFELIEKIECYKSLLT